jgi:hypothetical protein
MHGGDFRPCLAWAGIQRQTDRFGSEQGRCLLVADASERSCRVYGAAPSNEGGHLPRKGNCLPTGRIISVKGDCRNLIHL